MLRTTCCLITTATLLLACAFPAIAQEIRGSIAGRVVDSSGAVLPGATVIVVNDATGVQTKTVANEAGNFLALYLMPGIYTVTVEMSGFRAAVRRQVEVRVEDRVRLDVKLDPSGATETVDVVAAQPLLETRTATSGQVVDSQTIAEMPLGDGTAYFLARLAPGVEFTADPKFTRPMDNVNLAGVSASGIVRGRAAGENNDFASTEFMLDGVPNHVSQNRLGFSPPSSAVQEFKVSTSVYDAQFGQGTGGSVNLGLKSGTNRFRGDASYFNRDESRSANTFFSNRINQEKQARDYNRSTAMISGPILRNRTFFMISGEYLYDDAPEPLITSVPTERQRVGDFSEYLAVQMYDPFSTRREPDGRGGTRTIRDPFPGNVIPGNRLHPIGQRVMSYYPLPNLPRELWNANLTGNYFSDRNRPYDYRGMVSRVDHTINNNNRLFVNFFRNWRMEDRNNWAQAPITQAFDWRSNTGGLVGWTSVISAATVLDVRVNAHRFGEWQEAAIQLPASEFGFSQNVQTLARGYPYFPRIDLDTYLDIGSQRPGGRYDFSRPHTRYSLLPTLTHVRGKHTFKAGYDFRLVQEQLFDDGFRGGSFTFRGDFTNQGTGATGATTHRDLASLLVGMPTDGFFDTNARRDNRIQYHAGFVQDDWRVSQRLTLNLGLRWEIERGFIDTQNRNTRGFDLTSVNPLDAPARAQFAADFAANPTAYAIAPGQYIMTPDRYRALGGYTFADDRNREVWRTPKDNFLPRVGGAYLVNRKLVLRAGWGVFLTPYIMSGIDQRGFSRSTDVDVLGEDDLPRRGVLEDPIPGNQLLEPLGSSLGLLTSVGGDIGGQDDTVVPYDREIQRFNRFQAGFQYELPFSTLLEINYVGSRGSNLVTGRPMNYLPAEYLIDSITRDRPREDFLTGDVPNPFRNLPEIRATGLDRATLDRDQLIRQYPQFSAFRMQSYDGSNRYDSLQLRVDRRFSKGVMVSGNYTYARLLEKVTRLNDSDPELTERVSTGERPHSYKVATVIELPFGRGRKWGRNAGAFREMLFGGWRLSANYLWQAGAPLSWGNRYYDPTRNPNDLRSRYGKDAQGRRYGIDIPAWDVTGFHFHDAAVQTIDPATGQLVDDLGRQIADDRININNSRYKRSFPQTIDGMRQPPFFNLDVGLGKTFGLGRGRQLQVRAEAFNATNSPLFDGLNNDPRSGQFGKFNGQRNLPRDIQLGLRFSF